MNIQLEAGTFRKALALASHSVSGKSTIPILSHYLLVVDESGFHITATNRDTAISVWMKASELESGSITIPANLLRDLVANLPNDALTISVNHETNASTINCGRFTARVKGLSSADFPITTIGEKKMRTVIELPIEQMRSMINQVAQSASKDDSKPTLAGINFDLSAGAITMATTDGYRLAVRREEVDCRIVETIIIPAKTMTILADLFKDAADAANVRMEIVGRDRASWYFAGENDITAIEMSSGLIDARYPDYTAIIPKSVNTRCVINTAEMQRALKVSAIFSKFNSNIVRLSCVPANEETGVKGYISVGSDTEVGDNVATIDADVVGSEIEMAFDFRFLIDMLPTFAPSALFVMELTQTTRPGLFYPKEVAKDNHFCVIMPMHPPR